MKPEHDEWVYPFYGIVAVIVIMSIANAVVIEGRHKPANPVIRQLIDRT